MSRFTTLSRSTIPLTRSSLTRGFHSTRISRDHFLNATPEVFTKRALDSSSAKPLLVQFTASWCQPCRVLGPILQRLTGPESKYDLMTVDVDEQGELAGQYRVSAVPYVVAFKNGKQVDKFIGMKPEAQIKELLEKL